MDNKPKITAKEFFLQVGILATLYASIVSVISLLVQTINLAIPDKLESPYYYYADYDAGLRFAISTLLIVFPVFILLSWWSHRQVEKFPELKELALKKWFTFLTLFLSGATIIGDLIATINNFLAGEISLRFILKALAVLIIAALVFMYQIYEMRGAATARGYRLYRIVAILIVVASIVWSLFAVGSPATARNLRFDNRRVTDLQNIQGQIVTYWQAQEKLPDSLTQMEDSISGWKVPVDPTTNVPYEYSKTGDLSFELCANFALSSESARYSKYEIYSDPYYGGGEFNNWKHTEGRDCFTRTIDPKIYVPYAKARALEMAH